MPDAAPPDAFRLTLVTVPCLTDNYAFLIHDEASGTTALIDAPQAGPIQAALDARGWRLSDILLTHHHDDHVQGLGPLRSGARVIGAAADAHRLPPLDLAVKPGARLAVCGEEVQVIDVPGHTVGHMAYAISDGGQTIINTGDLSHHHVLLLQRPNTRFFVEVGDEHSKRFGSTAEDIFRLFTDLGYTAYFVRLAPLSPRIKLNPAHAPKPSGLTYDVFFCKESLRQPNGRL